MPIIYITNTGDRVETDLVTSLLVALQREQVPIDTVCGGKAQCGRCVVRVLRGREFLTKKRPPETLRLNSLQADDTMRLACQTFTRGDIEIEIINLRK